MKFLTTLPLALAINAVASSALKIPFKKARGSALQRRSTASLSKAVANSSKVLASGGSDNDFDINTVHDLIYLANITLGGNQYPVQIDTGSSDLWIKGSTSPIPNSRQTVQTYNLTYGIGWASGTVSYAAAEFAGVSIPSQAYMDVNVAQNPALSYGADGIVGLGFTALSTIDALVNMTNSSTGRSLLYNLFIEKPSDPNFIAFSLERDSADGSDTADGNFAIGEYDSKYNAIADTDSIPTFPETSPSRWTVLVDSLLIGTNQVAVSTNVTSAPGNKAVACLDSGTSYSYAPPEVCQQIYGNVPGASYDSSLQQWVVPCDAEIDMAIQINNQVYPLHPLDVSPYGQSNKNTCYGSFLPQTVNVGGGDFDWLLGDNFLRAVYSIYDFGDFDSSGKMGNPYIKLLSLIDPNQASTDFHNIRGGSARNNITYNASNSSSSTTTISLSSEVTEVLNKIQTFFPVMLAVMAFNALILLILVIVGVWFLCKKRGGRKSRGRKTSLPLTRTTRFSSNQDSNHTYQPVSMALTEDTFVPPNPAFKGDTMTSKTRPKSSFSSTAPLSPSTPEFPGAIPEDEPFTPPPPVFRSNVRPGDRPQSSFVPAPIRRQSSIPQGDRPHSAYSPSANSPSPQTSTWATPLSTTPNPLPTITTDSQEYVEPAPRSSSPPTAVSPEDSLFESPQRSFRASVQPGVRPRSYSRPVPPGSPTSLSPHGHVPGSPNTLSPLGRAPSPSSLSPPVARSFTSNVQPGDRPRSYVPTPASPEDELFAPPQAAFKGSDRPRSMA